MHRAKLLVLIFLLQLFVLADRTSGQPGEESATAPRTAKPLQSLPTDLAQRESQRIAALERIIPSVVCVMAADGQGGGSGVLISADGYAISNYHVTSGSGTFMKCGLSDGRLYDAVIVGIDPTGDVAMIRLLGRNDFSYAVPGDSDGVRVGDEVMALGNPFLLAADFTPTVTYGIVSGVHRYQYPANTFLEYTDCIQIDASINPGNSGGPLFDIEGRWIGINGRASFEKRGRVNAGAAYAISVRQVQLFLEHLKAGLIVDHGIADFTVETSGDGRAVISQVSEISEAWRRGLRPQHELVSFAGRPVSSANEFQNILGIFPEGSRVPLTWRDKVGVHSATIRLRPLHAFQKAPELPEERNPKSEDPEHPGPAPELLEAQKSSVPEIPAELQALFQARDGFANYHFNQLQREQLLAPLRTRLGTAPATSRNWVLAVTADGAGAAAAASGELIVGEAGSGLVLGSDNYYQPASQPAADNEPPGFHGLLAASILWHRLFERRETAFDDVVAVGESEFLPVGRSGRVLLMRTGPQSVRWYFDDTSPLPFAAEVDFLTGADEGRILFSDWQTDQGVPAPGRLGVVDAQTEQIHWLTVLASSVRDSGTPLPALGVKPEAAANPASDTTPGPADESGPKPDGAAAKNQVGNARGWNSSRIVNADFAFCNATFEASAPSAGRQEPLGNTVESGSDRQPKVITDRQAAVVKLFGAGVGNLDSYGSAIIISPEGHLITVWNHLINVGFLNAMTDDGKSYAVRVIGTSRDHDLAVLQLVADDGHVFPFVNLAEAAEAQTGDSVLGFSNMFHVATGREPVSVVHGVVASSSLLVAGNGRWNFPLKTPVLIVDAVTNNSGAAGGLLTRSDGTPVGLIGREIRNRGTNTWVNYAVPLTTLVPVIETVRSGRRVEPTAAESESLPLMADRRLTAVFGLTLLPDVVERTPAFVDGVVADSVVSRAGLQTGDLIVLFDDVVITSVSDFRRQIAVPRSGQRVALTVSRQQQLLTIEFRVP